VAVGGGVCRVGVAVGIGGTWVALGVALGTPVTVAVRVGVIAAVAEAESVAVAGTSVAGTTVAVNSRVGKEVGFANPNRLYPMMTGRTSATMSRSTSRMMSRSCKGLSLFTRSPP
jgi:hypothetical protein